VAEELNRPAGFSLRRVLLVVALVMSPIVLFACVGFALGYRLERTVGDSMTPALESGHHWIGRVIGTNDPLTRGEIVSFTPTPGQADLCNSRIQDGVRFVKRVIGLPGDVIADSNHELVLDGSYLSEPYLHTQPDGGLAFTPVQVPPGMVYLLGDDRAGSCDSRVFGPVFRWQIKDRLVLNLPG
jgi:signal peptidase I